jgi:DNA-binding beta-propeller fold protein YncE
LRKYLVAGMAATTVLAFGTTAVAQAPEATMTVSVSPTRAGTKQKPKSEKLTLTINNNNNQRTASALDIKSPSTITVSGKGFAKCTQAKLESDGKAACPAKSKVGAGAASALLGVNTPTPQQLHFKVTAFVGGPKAINFYLEGVELPGIKLVAPGTIKGHNLHVDIPQAAQQPVTGTWAGLQSLTTTLSAKTSKYAVVSSNGCKAKKHTFSTMITFVDNGVQPGGTVTTTAPAVCKK